MSEPVTIWERKPQNPEQRFWAKVDKDGPCWEWTAYCNREGYGRFGFNGKVINAHRVAWMFTNGPLGSEDIIDHICRNRSCVNPSHLRVVTQKQNQENREGPQGNSSSGVLGVSWHKAARKWNARVRHNKITYNLGLFESLAAAEAAVVAKRNELFTHNEVDRRRAHDQPPLGGFFVATV